MSHSWCGLCGDVPSVGDSKRLRGFNTTCDSWGAGGRGGFAGNFILDWFCQESIKAVV